jgi:hypothetical protein
MVVRIATRGISYDAGVARLLHSMGGVRTRLLAVAAVFGVLALACNEACLSVCEDRFDRCLESGRPHDECHALLDQCVEGCPPRDP